MPATEIQTYQIFIKYCTHFQHNGMHKFVTSTIILLTLITQKQAIQSLHFNAC